MLVIGPGLSPGSQVIRSFYEYLCTVNYTPASLEMSPETFYIFKDSTFTWPYFKMFAITGNQDLRMFDTVLSETLNLYVTEPQSQFHKND